MDIECIIRKAKTLSVKNYSMEDILGNTTIRLLSESIATHVQRMILEARVEELTWSITKRKTEVSGKIEALKQQLKDLEES